MRRGTVLFTGSMSRESEIFVHKLEKEQFHVVTCKDESTLVDWLKRGSQQAVLCSATTPQSEVEKLIKQIKRYARKRYLPFLLVASEEVPPYVATNKAIGEVLRLHCMPLKEAVRRLQLAIQLTQLKAQLKA